MVAAALYPDPQILYDPDPEMKPSLKDLYGAPFGGVTLGLASHAVYNYFSRRPLRANVYMYVIWGVGLGTGFELIHRALAKYYSRRDTIHKHYIQLHPEDFPPPPKVKIGEMLEDWRPVR